VSMNCRFCNKEMKPRTGRNRLKPQYACKECITSAGNELEELKRQHVKKVRGITDSHI
jgi:hypothetical protein